MIIIDDVGTGCIIGIPVVIGLKDDKVEVIEMQDLKGTSACEEVFKLLDRLGVTKDEEIKICRGNVFNKFYHQAKQLGYKNIERVVIEGDTQEKIEEIFMNSLHNLGLSNEVKLEGKNYSKLHEDICSQLILNPKLLQYVRPHYRLNKHYTNLLYKIERMNNEFPNLLKVLA